MFKEWLQPNSHVHLHNCKCKSWLCPVCRSQRARLLRYNLHCKVALFSEPRLVTLTLDSKKFGSPEDAYRYVRDNKFIPRFFRLVGVKKYVCVMECHKSGYPHWHCLIDVASLPSTEKNGVMLKHYLDLFA